MKLKMLQELCNKTHENPLRSSNVNNGNALSSTSYILKIGAYDICPNSISHAHILTDVTFMLPRSCLGFSLLLETLVRPDHWAPSTIFNQISLFLWSLFLLSPSNARIRQSSCRFDSSFRARDRNYDFEYRCCFRSQD